MGFLVTQDATRYDEGVAMRDVPALANNSAVGEIVILLDCCHSGLLGEIPGIENDRAVLREGVSVLTSELRGATLSGSSGGHSRHPAPSEEAFLAAGEEVVRRSDTLFAIWDGKPLALSWFPERRGFRDKGIEQMVQTSPSVLVDEFFAELPVQGIARAAA